MVKVKKPGGIYKPRLCNLKSPLFIDRAFKRMAEHMMGEINQDIREKKPLDPKKVLEITKTLKELKEIYLDQRERELDERQADLEKREKQVKEALMLVDELEKHGKLKRGRG